VETHRKTVVYKLCVSRELLAVVATSIHTDTITQ